MRILTLAALAALGVAACTDRDDYGKTETTGDQAAATTDYGAAASADAARAAASADAARDAATTTTRTVVVPDPDDRVTVQVGPDGARVNATVDTD